MDDEVAVRVAAPEIVEVDDELAVVMMPS